ncbi:MAG: hypothetical protein VW378_00845 [bacterium]
MDNVLLFFDDPYGYLFFILIIAAAFLFFFNRVSKILYLMIMLVFMYLLYMYFNGQPAPELPQFLDKMVQEKLTSFKNWSKGLLWDKRTGV